MKPMTMQELFNKICEILKAKDLLPDSLDYALAGDESVLLTNSDFELKSNLDYGASEGIYLDLWLKFFDSKGYKDFGTFKTLNTDREDMHTMAGILADFILELHSFIAENQDAFSWEGFNVYPLDPKLNYHYVCESINRALELKDELLEKCIKVSIRSNETREEIVYERS